MEYACVVPMTDDGTSGRGIRARPTGVVAIARDADGTRARVMASVIARARAVVERVARRGASAATSTYDAVAPRAIAAYEDVMEKNARYVVRNPERVRRLGREFVYSHLARLPDAVRAASGEMAVARESVKRARAGEMDVATAATAGVFAAELYAWFCVGEIVGRGGKLTGY